MDVSKRQNDLKRLCLDLDETKKNVTEQLIEDIIFLEVKLAELRQYPFISVNPKNPVQQKPTPAAKQYKELLQQYNNCIKIMLSLTSKESTGETSPLREYLKKLKSGEKSNANN